MQLQTAATVADAAAAITLVKRIVAPLKSIADQVIRSAASVPADLAERQGRTGRDRVNFWRIAYAPAKDVDSHLWPLTGAGAVHRAAAGDWRRPLARTLDAAAAFRGSHPKEFRMNRTFER